MSEDLYLLDTSILLALVRGEELGSHIDQRFGLRRARQLHLVCIVSHGEIWVLARRNNWGRRKCQTLQIILDNLVTVQLDHPAVIDAYVHLDLYSQSYPQGARNMSKNDLWIAAAARASGATLLTTDLDFAHLIPSEVSGVIVPVQTRRLTLSEKLERLSEKKQAAPKPVHPRRRCEVLRPSTWMQRVEGGAVVVVGARTGGRQRSTEARWPVAPKGLPAWRAVRQRVHGSAPPSCQRDRQARYSLESARSAALSAGTAAPPASSTGTPRYAP